MNRSGRLSLLISLSTLAVLSLTGCASSPPVNYYQLETLNAGPESPAADAPVLVLGPIILPDYLSRPQMVTHGDGARLNVDDFNRWAEPLDQATIRVLASNLDGLIRELVVVQPGNRALSADYRLFASIRGFETDASGTTTLVVQWGVRDMGGGSLVSPRTGRYEARAGSPQDPQAVARTMSDVLAAFSRDAADTIRASLQDTAAPAARPAPAGR